MIDALSRGRLRVATKMRFSIQIPIFIIYDVNEQCTNRLGDFALEGKQKRFDRGKKA
jgi:hypothetical protein